MPHDVLVPHSFDLRRIATTTISGVSSTLASLSGQSPKAASSSAALSTVKSSFTACIEYTTHRPGTFRLAQPDHHLDA